MPISGIAGGSSPRNDEAFATAALGLGRLWNKRGGRKEIKVDLGLESTVPNRPYRSRASAHSIDCAGDTVCYNEGAFWGAQDDEDVDAENRDLCDFWCQKLRRYQGYCGGLQKMKLSRTER
ncbi:unnamed protein product [Tuber aestivum]|uniref:Uncharacterized protein n=1 Tax=Tuber aestivum TaxID=59557 RepID=A0A292Q5Q2_9PEZI|nr:unnamed protein product [Tuber aestivum]